MRTNVVDCLKGNFARSTLSLLHVKLGLTMTWSSFAYTIISFHDIIHTHNIGRQRSRSEQTYIITLIVTAFSIPFCCVDIKFNSLPPSITKSTSKPITYSLLITIDSKIKGVSKFASGFGGWFVVLLRDEFQPTICAVNATRIYKIYGWETISWLIPHHKQTSNPKLNPSKGVIYSHRRETS